MCFSFTIDIRLLHAICHFIHVNATIRMHSDKMWNENRRKQKNEQWNAFGLKIKMKCDSGWCVHTYQ